MKEEKLNGYFRIKKEELDGRLEYSTQLPENISIVPLRQLERADSIIPMKTSEMEAFLRHIPLVNGREIFPYKDASFSRHVSSPHGLHVPQTFILRRKLVSLLEGLDKLYEDFCFPCLSQRASHYVLGTNKECERVAGVYLPPLVEIINGGNMALLIDGNHRMALSAVGAPSETILIKGSKVAPPYGGMRWHRHFVDEKPPIEERYVDFNRTLFKDFGYVGIDG